MNEWFRQRIMAHAMGIVRTVGKGGKIDITSLLEDVNTVEFLILQEPKYSKRKDIGGQDGVNKG